MKALCGSSGPGHSLVEAQYPKFLSTPCQPEHGKISDFNLAPGPWLLRVMCVILERFVGARRLGPVGGRRLSVRPLAEASNEGSGRVRLLCLANNMASSMQDSTLASSTQECER